jgi:hypothetical protein
VIWGLIDLAKIEIVLSGQPDNVVVSDDLKHGGWSLLNLLAKNPALSSREIIGIDPLQWALYGGRSHNRRTRWTPL